MDRCDGPRIAILIWGNELEDYLAQLGLAIEDFCTRVPAGWLHGYIKALRQVGISCVVVAVSARVSCPTRIVNESLGATFHVLPSTRAYRALRRRMTYPYGRNAAETFGRSRGIRRLGYPGFAVLREAAPYLATPIWELIQVLRRERCDAVLCQEYEYARFDLAVLLARLLRIPVFAVFQGGTSPFGWIEARLRPRAIRVSDGVIVGPKAELERIMRQYRVPAGRVARIVNPVDTDVWYFDPDCSVRRDLGIPDSALVVAWHGRVVMHNKGLDTLLDAWCQLSRKHPADDFRLLLIGAGDDQERLRSRLSQQRAKPVIWIDRYIVDQAEVRRYLSSADVYVFPSRHEGFPVAPLEAMACGLPIVATDASGVPDILEDGEGAGGLLVPRDDPDAFAAALERILFDDDLRRTLGQNARWRISADFSLESVGARLRSFLVPTVSTGTADRT